MSFQFFELGFDKFRYDFLLELYRLPVGVKKSIRTQGLENELLKTPYCCPITKDGLLFQVHY
jgi:hypothetical protein